MIMGRVSQEFYCGECDHYFVVRLNMALNHEALIVCPNKDCKHEHRRCIVEGIIYEQGRFETDHEEEILPNPATLSKTPITDKMRKAAETEGPRSYCKKRRDGVPLGPLAESWARTSLREKGL